MHRFVKMFFTLAQQIAYEIQIGRCSAEPLLLIKNARGVENRNRCDKSFIRRDNMAQLSLRYSEKSLHIIVVSICNEINYNIY